MKKVTLLSIALIVSSMIFAQNLNFENWETNTVEMLDGYETMTNSEPVNGPFVVIRSTDSYSGMYSLRLETIETTEGDTLFGFFANGNPETMEGGVELLSLSAIDSIVGYYKYNVQPNDTALILCVAKKSGIPSGGDAFIVTGVQNTWKRFAYPIEAMFADSFIVAAASSNAINEIGIAPGSYLMLDSVFLKHNTQGIEYINNHSFEHWTSINWDDLASWTTYNKYLVGQPTMSAAKTNDSHTGNFACHLSTLLLNGVDTLPGAIIYGEGTMNGPVSGVNYNENPDIIRFYYKSSFTSVDTARVQFAFKNNGNIIGYFGANIMSNEVSYKLYEFPVSLSQVPDTVYIYANSGENPGSELVIDDIEFILPVGITEAYSIKQVVAFPIPAINKLNFEINTDIANYVNISIYNILGELILTNNYQNISENQKISVDIAKLQKGNYIYKINIDDEVYTKQFVKK